MVLVFCVRVIYKHKDSDPGLSAGMSWVASFPVIATAIVSEKFPWVIALVITALSLFISFYLITLFNKRKEAKDQAEREEKERRQREQMRKLNDWVESHNRVKEKDC